MNSGSDPTLDFDELMKKSLICLKIIRAHPEIDHNFVWWLQIIAFNMSFATFLYPLFYGLTVVEDVRNNIPDFMAIASMIVVSFVIFFHLFVVLNYGATFKIVFSDVRKHYEIAKELPEEEINIVRKYALEGSRVTRYWAVVLMLGFSNFCLVPLMRMLYYVATGSFQYVLVIKLKYSDFLSYFQEGLGFWIGYLFWMGYITYCCLVYTAAVPLGPIFLLHSCGQLELLRTRMMKLFPDDTSIIPREERTRKLRDIAAQLRDIYDFVDNLKICLKLQYELTLKGSALIIPIVMYVLVETLSDKQLRPEFINLLSGAIIICSVPCYFGNRLSEKSSELQEAVYSSGWEKLYDKPTRSTLLILMTRMQQTVAIRSIFVTVNLEALADVFKQAYTLFNFLYTVMNE